MKKKRKNIVSRVKRSFQLLFTVLLFSISAIESSSAQVNPGHAGHLINGYGAIPYLDEPTSVKVSGNFAYVVSHKSRALEIVDITNPAVPVHKGSITNGEGGAFLGRPMDIFIQGNYAYIPDADNSALEIVNISNPSAPKHAGSIVSGEGGALLYSPWAVHVSGDYAFVASLSSDALEIVDVSDPTNPIHAGSLTHGTGGALLDGPADVFVLGNHAYVASSTSDALEIIDVSNPANPVHAGSITNGTGGAVFDSPLSVFVEGNYAYVTSGVADALEIVDVSDPANPVHAGSLTNGEGGALLDSPYSVYVSGNYAYIASRLSDAIEIIDVSIPTAPFHAGNLINGAGGALLDDPRSVYVVGEKAYLASYNSDALEIVNISNPTFPIHSGSLIDGTGGAQLFRPKSVFVLGNYAYVASPQSDALEIVDISKPSNPEHVSSVLNGENGALLSDASSVYVSGNYAYVASLGNDALEIIDVGNPANPDHAASLTHGTGGALLDYPQSVFVSGNYAYVCSGQSDALEIVDVSDPSDPVHIGSVTDGALLDFAAFSYVAGNYAYVAGKGSDAFVVVDVSDPVNPAIVGSLSNGEGGALLEGPSSIYILGNYAFVTSEYSNALEIIDISIPTTPTHISSLVLPAASSSWPRSVYLFGNYAFIAAYFEDVLEVVDISDPANPILTHRLIDDTGGAFLNGPESVFISGNYAYVTTKWDDALEVIYLYYPGITELSTNSGAVGESVTITGLNFNTNALVSFNGVEASPPTDVSLSSLTVTIPENAQMGKLSLQVGEFVTLSEEDFFIIPTSSTATSILNNGFTANWSNVGADEYFLDLSTDNFASYVPGFENLSVGDVTSFNVNGLNPATAYQYRVRGSNENGTSGSSNSISVLTIPATPNALAATSVTQTSFVANWEPVTGADNYFLEVAQDIDFSFPVPGYEDTNAIDPSIENVEIDSLIPGIIYYYRVSAENAAGKTEESNIIEQITIPANPTAFGASAITQSSFDANWVGETGADSYYLEVFTDSAFLELVPGFDGTTPIDASNVSVTVSPLSAGITHYYRVSAENSAGASGTSNIISQITIPPNPTALEPEDADISSSSFKANWKPAEGASSYDLEVSLDGFSTFLAGYDPFTLTATEVEITSLQANTEYQFRVRAKNSAGISGNSNVATVTTFTEAPPAALSISNFEYSPTQTLNSSQVMLISAIGGTPPYTLTLYHKGILEPNFESEIVNESTSGNYQVAIEAEMLDVMGLDFMIELRDSNNAEDIEKGQIMTAFSATASPDIPFEKFGGTDDSWNLFSIPYDLENKSVSAILTDYDPARYEFDWKIMRYRNSTNDYVNFNTGQVSPGEAYWFNAKQQLSVKTGAGNTISEIPFSLTLLEGWNLIGNPYPVNISWNSVITTNEEENNVEPIQMHNPGARSFQSGDIIVPFSGGFVWSNASTTVNISPTENQSSTRTKKSEIVSMDLDGPEWRLLVKLSSNGSSYQPIAVGVHPEAKPGKDFFDKMTLPRFFNYLEMYSVHDDYMYPWFSEDIRTSADEHTWHFIVESDEAHDKVSLTWDQEAIENSSANLILVDENEGRLVNLKETDSYEFGINRAGRFVIIYSRDPDQVFLPSNIFLGDAYPNPANSKMMIPVTLPDSEESYGLRLIMYDLHGRRVQTIAEGTFAPGFYEFGCDLDEKLVAGIYLYRLSFDESDLDPVQKRIVIKR